MVGLLDSIVIFIKIRVIFTQFFSQCNKRASTPDNKLSRESRTSTNSQINRKLRISISATYKSIINLRADPPYYSARSIYTTATYNATQQSTFPRRVQKIPIFASQLYPRVYIYTRTSESPAPKKKSRPNKGKRSISRSHTRGDLRDGAQLGVTRLHSASLGQPAMW